MRRAGTVQPIDGSDRSEYSYWAGRPGTRRRLAAFPCTAALLHTERRHSTASCSNNMSTTIGTGGYGWIKKKLGRHVHHERTLDVVWYSGSVCTPHFQELPAVRARVYR